MLSKFLLNSFIVLGLVVPYAALAVFIVRYGLNVPLLVQQAFATPGAVFFALDVVMAALFMLYLALTDSRVKSVRHWLALAVLLVGPSFALPLYVKLRTLAPKD